MNNILLTHFILLSSYYGKAEPESTEAVRLLTEKVREEEEEMETLIVRGRTKGPSEAKKV